MAQWSSAYVAALPDASFAAIDAEGKRHLPYRDHTGALDAAHVKNALARLEQTQIPDALKSSAKKKLQAAAKALGIGIGQDGESGGG